MALLTPPLAPLLSPARHRVASPPLLAAAATTPSPLISLFRLGQRHHGAPCPNGRRRRWGVAASLDQEESSGSETTVAAEEDPGPPVSADAAAEDRVAASGEQAEASPEDLENIREVKRVLELLKKNRDMTFGEVKLTIMIEDPRDIERKRTLGIEDPDEITRDDLADALVEVNEGRIPENRVALQLLAKEMAEWPDIEVMMKTEFSFLPTALPPRVHFWIRCFVFVDGLSRHYWNLSCANSFLQFSAVLTFPCVFLLMDAQLGISGKLTFPRTMSLAEASSFKQEAEARAAGDEAEEGHAARDRPGRPFHSGSSATDLSSHASSISYRKARQDKIGGDGFWCGVLCMHLPGLSRRRSMQQQQSMSLSEADTRASTTEGPGGARASTVSKVTSMERFKYSSSSSGIVFERADKEEEEEEEEEEEVSAYFDLPLELLRISSVDTESPVTAAFVFDGNRGRGAKMIVPEMQDLDFSFPAPPDFSNPSSPRS
ncbi:Protein CHLOROPLAST ENHANCING STRESS TOLERANCE, chloroplastic [Dichanthelium oligosanthes]|uniref:Protein CHLOROPLAST ENHANCING STRESS TOLERANCE, chloroplastic n=1 Tax=Dichanthelium oligosanthes TaxID=888268 RepID=A0A1E5VL93_9POAL|nr:Protein CHLOROPLAST ENHANCING STRESS TOLERANCE, chloroplastic [Dichanthelium oligosanthes]